MDVYNKELEGRIAEQVINKYKSYYQLLENIEKLMK